MYSISILLIAIVLSLFCSGTHGTISKSTGNVTFTGEEDQTISAFMFLSSASDAPLVGLFSLAGERPVTTIFVVDVNSENMSVITSLTVKTPIDSTCSLLSGANESNFYLYCTKEVFSSKKDRPQAIMKGPVAAPPSCIAAFTSYIFNGQNLTAGPIARTSLCLQPFMTDPTTGITYLNQEIERESKIGFILTYNLLMFNPATSNVSLLFSNYLGQDGQPISGFVIPNGANPTFLIAYYDTNDEPTISTFSMSGAIIGQSVGTGFSPQLVPINSPFALAAAEVSEKGTIIQVINYQTMKLVGYSIVRESAIPFSLQQGGASGSFGSYGFYALNNLLVDETFRILQFQLNATGHPLKKGNTLDILGFEPHIAVNSQYVIVALPKNTREVGTLTTLKRLPYQ